MGIALLMGCDLLSVGQFVRSANLAVIVFLVGTFLVVGFLEENLFFEHVVGAIVRLVGPRPRVLLLVLVLTATVSSAIVGEVAATLFMAGAVLHLCDRYKLAPLPFVMTVVFAVNCGSAASSVGPIGVTIALRAHLTFGDFLRWASPIALVASLASLGLCRWWFAAAFRAFEAAVRSDPANGNAARAAEGPGADAGAPGAGAADAAAGAGVGAAVGPGAAAMGLDGEPALSAEQERAYDQGLERPAGATAWVNWLVFLGTVALFLSHSLLEAMLRPGAGHDAGGRRPADGRHRPDAQRPGAQRLLDTRVDWWTLAFFMMLFAAVGTLEQTGVTGVLADRLRPAPGRSPAGLVQIVGWATGGLSAFLDNLLAVATFLPVVDQVRTGPAGSVTPAAPCPQAIYWMMLFGGTFMGNMTVIGSTANIIACGLLEKRGHGTVRFIDWFKIGLPVSLVSMLLATLLLGAQTGWFRYPVMPTVPGVTGVTATAAQGEAR